MSTNATQANSPWLPWKLDQILLDERIARWQWYWVFSLFAIGLLAYIYISPLLVDLTEYIAIWTQTIDLFEAYSTETHNIFLKGNIYSFLFPAVSGLFLILTCITLLSLQRKSLTIGLTYNIPFSWKPFWKASLALSLLFAINVTYLFLHQRESISIQDPALPFILWFALGLFVLLIQALGEELIFRGYILRVFGSLFPIRIVAISIVMAIFIYQHLNYNTGSGELLAIIIFFMTSELVYFWILFRTRSIMATWGLRWVNSIFFMLIISVTVDDDQSFTLLKYSFSYAKVEESYFEDPQTYLLQIISIAMFVTLIIWKKSPFYLKSEKTAD